jgi:hypothetical protein
VRNLPLGGDARPPFLALGRAACGVTERRKEVMALVGMHVEEDEEGFSTSRRLSKHYRSEMCG